MDDLLSFRSLKLFPLRVSYLLSFLVCRIVHEHDWPYLCHGDFMSHILQFYTLSYIQFRHRFESGLCIVML